MRFDKFVITTATAVCAFALPGWSQATSIYHAAGGEAGFTYHPDHASGGKSRAEVRAELEAARKDGTLALLQRGAPVPIQNAGPHKSRKQVIDEMLGESPEQRRLRWELSGGG